MKERAFELRGGGGQQLNVATGATLCSLAEGRGFFVIRQSIIVLAYMDVVYYSSVY